MSITRKKKQNGLFYTKAEERINTLSHAAGILMGIIVGTIFLVKGYQSGNWILMDYGDIIVHAFCREDRLFYDLERIWRDGKIMSKEDFPA